MVDIAKLIGNLLTNDVAVFKSFGCTSTYLRIYILRLRPLAPLDTPSKKSLKQGTSESRANYVYITIYV